jgi:hypothetical protein
VGSYLVKSMGIQASLQLLEQARGFFAGKLSGQELLAHTPVALVLGLRAAMAEVFDQRAQLFRPA